MGVQDLLEGWSVALVCLPPPHTQPLQRTLLQTEALHPDMLVPLPCLLLSLAVPLSKTWFIRSSLLLASHTER